jgi:hypothetical protein
MDAMTTESTGPDDESLIRRAAEGEETALAELFDRYRKRLRQMVRLRLDRGATEAALGVMTRGLVRNGNDPRGIRTIHADLRRQAEALILEPIFPADPFVPLAQ